MRKEGFTLIELLVVISIMAIISSIAIPNFSAYREKTRNIESTIWSKEVVYAAQSCYQCDNKTINIDNIKNYIESATQANVISITILDSINKKICINFQKEKLCYFAEINLKDKNYIIKDSNSKIILNDTIE